MQQRLGVGAGGVLTQKVTHTLWYLPPWGLLTFLHIFPHRRHVKTIYLYNCILPYLHFVDSKCFYSKIFLISSSEMCFLSMLFDSLKGIRISVYLVLLALKWPLWEKYQCYKCKSSLENKAVGKIPLKSFSYFFLYFPSLKESAHFFSTMTIIWYTKAGAHKWFDGAPLRMKHITKYYQCQRHRDKKNKRVIGSLPAGVFCSLSWWLKWTILLTIIKVKDLGTVTKKKEPISFHKHFPKYFSFLLKFFICDVIFLNHWYYF